MTDVDTALWRSDLGLIADAARQAGDVALGYFNQSPEVWWKNEGRSPVSAADFAANQKLESILRTARPDYGWLSEETDDDGDRLSRETLFIIDPIDGTRAFLAGQDLWCVSVAVVRHGRPVAGVLYAPALEELYEAVEGGVGAEERSTDNRIDSAARCDRAALPSAERRAQAHFRKRSSIVSSASGTYRRLPYRIRHGCRRADRRNLRQAQFTRLGPRRRRFDIGARRRLARRSPE